MSDERVRPFSCGSEFADWTASNCEQCVASAPTTFDDHSCPLEQALGVAYLTDGKIARHAARLIHCDGVYPQPCTLRHHKNDPSLTRDAVLARIDAALNPTSPVPPSGSGPKVRPKAKDLAWLRMLGNDEEGHPRYRAAASRLLSVLEAVAARQGNGR